MLKKTCLAALFAPFIGLAALAMPLQAQAIPKIQSWTAPSGARVLFVEDHTLHILDVQVDIDAGSARDALGKEGVADFTQGMLTSGAGNLSEDAISDRLADVGAELGGGTEADRVSVSLRTLSEPENRNAALKIMAMILAKPTFPKAILERERARAQAGLEEAKTRPDAILDKRFAQLAYGSHPYGRFMTLQSLAKISVKDLQHFHQTYYTAKAAQVSLVGNISRSEAEHIAQQLTEGLPQGAAPAPIEAVLPSKRITEQIPHPASQAHVVIGEPSLVRGDPDFFPLVVGNYVLGGGGFISRLMKEIRDARGLSYSVQSYFIPQKASGPFQISFETKAEQVNEAVSVAHNTLTQFLAQGPTEEELQAAKDNIINGFALRLDANRKILGQVAVIGYYHLPLDYLDQYIGKIQSVTTAQVKEAFARHVKESELVTVIVGGKQAKSDKASETKAAVK